MKYTKQAISIPDQISKLKARGLRFGDEAKAANYLSNISFYRLRAYTYPFQDNNDPEHPFIKQVSFEEILRLYVFDRQMRLLLFNALEKIEIAFRTQIIYEYAMAHGAYICCMQYFLNIISPGHSFRERLISLMDECPLLQEKEMGFPKGWQQEKIWQKA